MDGADWQFIFFVYFNFLKIYWCQQRKKMEEWKINKSLGTNYRASHRAEKHDFGKQRNKKNNDSEKLHSSLNTAAMKI